MNECVSPFLYRHVLKINPPPSTPPHPCHDLNYPTMTMKSSRLTDSWQGGGGGGKSYNWTRYTIAIRLYLRKESQLRSFLLYQQNESILKVNFGSVCIFHDCSGKYAFYDALILVYCKNVSQLTLIIKYLRESLWRAHFKIHEVQALLLRKKLYLIRLSCKTDIFLTFVQKSCRF